MLVLSLRRGKSLRLGRSKEAIAAGQFIEVRLTGIGSNQAKIGIEATGEVNIFRDDVFAKWCEENNVIPLNEPTKPIFEPTKG